MTRRLMLLLAAAGALVAVAWALLFFWQLNPTDFEDVLKVNADSETGEGGDDWYDCVRYGLGSRPWKAPDPDRGAPFSIWSPEILAAEHERLYLSRMDTRTHALPLGATYDELE